MPKIQPNAKRKPQTGGWRCCPACHARIETNIPRAVKAGQVNLSQYAQLRALIEPRTKQALIDAAAAAGMGLSAYVRTILRRWEADGAK